MDSRNGLTVENPGSLDRVGHFGWGRTWRSSPAKAVGFHIPLATPVIIGDVRAQVQRQFLMFDTSSGSIRNVHIYDGSGKVREFNDLPAIIAAYRPDTGAGHPLPT